MRPQLTYNTGVDIEISLYIQLIPSSKNKTFWLMTKISVIDKVYIYSWKKDSKVVKVNLSSLDGKVEIK